MHRKVLESKGYNVTQADFLAWSGDPVDRIVANPPFSEGRWRAHIEHAASMLKPGGRIVAILPESAKNSDVLGHMKRQWKGPFHNEFPGTSVSVVILKADRT